MASELKVDKITGVATAGSISVTGEGNSTTTNLQQGLTKSWANINTSSTPSVIDSLNVSGLVDDAQGQINVAFTSVMGNANYSCTCCGTAAANGVVFDYSTKVSSSFDWRQIDNDGTKQDTTNATTMVAGDLA